MLWKHPISAPAGISRQQSGAVEACWAHNPEVRGSKPRSATFLVITDWPSPSYFGELRAGGADLKDSDTNLGAGPRRSHLDGFSG